MTQSPAQSTPMPGQGNQPEVKGAPLTDAEKKAQADKESCSTTKTDEGSCSTKS